MARRLCRSQRGGIVVANSNSRLTEERPGGTLVDAQTALAGEIAGGPVRGGCVLHPPTVARARRSGMSLVEPRRARSRSVARGGGHWELFPSDRTTAPRSAPMSGWCHGARRGPGRRLRSRLGHPRQSPRYDAPTRARAPAPAVTTNASPRSAAAANFSASTLRGSALSYHLPRWENLSIEPEPEGTIWPGHEDWVERDHESCVGSLLSARSVTLTNERAGGIAELWSTGDDHENTNGGAVGRTPTASL